MGQINRSRLFDDWAMNYDKDMASDEGSFPFSGYEQILDCVVDLADVKPNMRVLDIGIGTGNLAVRFINRGCNVWGLDFSAEMLAKTQAKIPQAKLIQADLLSDWTKELQLPFERVVSAYVFHEFDLATKMRLLQQVFSSCLSANGFAVIADIAYPTIDVREEASRHCQQWDEDEHYWAAEEASTACEHMGLQVTYEQISSCGGVFTFTRQNAG